MKNWKTTTTGIVVAVMAALETFLPFLEGNEQLDWVQVISAVAIAVFGTLAKDHDKDNNEEIAVVADTGGVGPKRPPKDDDEG